MDSSRLVQIQSSGPAFALSKNKEEGMLKIMITNTTKEERWTLQGRLVVPGGRETERELEQGRRAQGRTLHRETTQIQEARK